MSKTLAFFLSLGFFFLPLNVRLDRCPELCKRLDFGCDIDLIWVFSVFSMMMMMEKPGFGAKDQILFLFFLSFMMIMKKLWVFWKGRIFFVFL